MPFLRKIAQTYLQRYPNDISDFTFIFPNRRAGLFFRRYLAQIAGQPIFSPNIITIEQLFEKFSNLKLADQTELLFRLFQTYRNIYLFPQHTDETFDSFIFWGRMMLSDFNDVDMQMADAEKLFANLSDIKDIESRFSIDEEQLSSLKTFLDGFSKKNKGQYRDRFLNHWQVMLPIYNAFRDNLLHDQLAYQGMLCRQVLTNNDIPTLATQYSKRYIFVGFNALNEVERQLMLQLKEANIADFCWDYYHPILRDPQNRASLFSNHQGLENTYDLQTNDQHFPKITLVEVPSETGQAKVLTQLLQQLNDEGIDDWTTTGIILPDEHLLSVIRNSIPGCVKRMNITMGQTLTTTPIISLLQHLNQIQLSAKLIHNNQTLFYHIPVLALLSHPYITDQLQTELSGIRQTMLNNNMIYVSKTLFEHNQLLNLIFTYHRQPNDILPWLRQVLLMLVHTDSPQQEKNEYIYQTIIQINKLESLLKTYPNILITNKTLFQILINLVSIVRVPFEGEPLAGMQIMGMLESRAMSFTNLFITDVNDDTLPGKSQQQTYIPYDLRRAYNLPTPERQDTIYAYNFYRLITQAEKVWLLQNTTSNDLHSGETSRFVKQLQYQYNINIDKIIINSTPNTAISHTELSINKGNSVVNELTTILCNSINAKKRGLSPSALNTYISCPLKFYLTYIKNFRETEKISNYMEPNKFGNIIHKIMQSLYFPYEGGKTVNTADVELMLKKVNTTELTKNIYIKEQLSDNSDAILEGKDFLNIYVINKYINNILQYDKTITPFVYLASEIDLSTHINIEGIGQVYIHGFIDRIDIKDSELRVIDYKTGKDKAKLKTLELLFTHDTPNSDHTRQALIYCLLLYNTLIQSQQSTHTKIQALLQHLPKDYSLIPHIYYVREHSDKIDTVIGHNYADIAQQFEQSLRYILTEIFDTTIPFKATTDEKNCKHCPFIDLCS